MNNFNYNKIRIAIYVVGFLLILTMTSGVYLYTKLTKANDRLEDYKNLNESLKSELIITRNDLGQEEAKRESLVLHNSDVLLKLQTSDSTIIRLQNLVRRYEREKKELNNAIVFLTNTVNIYRDSMQNQVVSTVMKGDTVYHTYKRDINMMGKWITGKVELGINNFEIDLKVHNIYEIATYSERNGFLKPKIHYVKITNLNPYTSVQDLWNYEVKAPECKWKTPLLVGTITGTVGTLLIINALR